MNILVHVQRKRVAALNVVKLFTSFNLKNLINVLGLKTFSSGWKKA
jgi:hypothetical protein